MTCENCYNKKACLKKAETCDLKSVKMHNISFWDSAESCEFFLNKEEIEGAGVLEKKEREVMKTMPEYIEREALKKALKENHDAIMQDPTYGTQRKWWEELRYNRVRSILSKIPTADVAEVRHGEWRAVADFGDGNCFGYCSVCGTPQKAESATALRLFHRHCRWCGAKMDGKGEENA